MLFGDDPQHPLEFKVLGTQCLGKADAGRKGSTYFVGRLSWKRWKIGKNIENSQKKSAPLA